MTALLFTEKVFGVIVEAVHLQRSNASLRATNSIMEKEDIVRLSRAIQEIITKSGQTRLRPKELMPDLITKGFFKKDEKFGKPLRDVLNRLDKIGQLNLIPQVVADRQEKAVYWYFEVADIPEPKPEKKKPAAKKTVLKAKTGESVSQKTTAVKKVTSKDVSSKVNVKKPVASVVMPVKEETEVKKIVARTVKRKLK